MKNINKLTIINENERSGRSYTFYFKSENIKREIEKLVFDTKDKIDIGTIINDIKSRKDLYYSLNYKILNVDHAVDIIAYSIDDNKVKIPLIDRGYPPLGLALPGGFIDDNETRYEAAKRELEEELKIKPLNEKYFETKFYNGKDENGNLYDSRGEVTTSAFVVEIDKNSKCIASDDASNFETLEIDLNKDIIEQLKTYKFAMNRHKELLVEGINIIKELNLDIKLSMC